MEGHVKAVWLWLSAFCSTQHSWTATALVFLTFSSSVVSFLSFNIHVRLQHTFSWLLCTSFCFLDWIFHQLYWKYFFLFSEYFFLRALLRAITDQRYTRTAYHDSREGRHWSETGDACGVAWIQHVGNHPTDGTGHESGIESMTSGKHQGSTVQNTCKETRRRKWGEIEGWGEKQLNYLDCVHRYHSALIVLLLPLNHFFKKRRANLRFFQHVLCTHIELNSNNTRITTLAAAITNGVMKVRYDSMEISAASFVHQYIRCVNVCFSRTCTLISHNIKTTDR